MNCMAHSLGAPVTVTAQAWARKASRASKPSRRRPSTWSTVWIRREYISICRRPITRTLPGRQMRDLSLRSTSVHMVSSASSLAELSRSEDLGGVGERVLPARDGAGDRAGLDAVALHAHVHLGRCAHQVLRLPEVDEEAVGRRVALAQAPEHLGGRRRAWLEEHLARNHLEEVAAPEAFARTPHTLRVLAGRVVARALDRAARPRRARRRPRGAARA